MRLGRLAGDGKYVATIEPWHGSQVVVYAPPTVEATTLWRRRVIDNELQWGHALWCVNLDDDADEELVVGVRDQRGEAASMGVRIYDPQCARQGEWRRYCPDFWAAALISASLTFLFIAFMNDKNISPLTSVEMVTEKNADKIKSTMRCPLLMITGR